MSTEPIDASTMEMLSPLLLTRDEVAITLRVTVSTIDNLHRTTQLCGVKVGRHLRWRLSDVHRFVDGLGGEDHG